MSKLVEKFRDVTARRPSGWLGRKMYHDPKGHYPSFRMVMERLQLRPEDKFLEVACGGGSLLEMALEKVVCAAAIDHSADMVKLASERNRLAIERGRLEIARGDVGTLPWPDQSFTCAACTNAFFFFEHPDRMLKESFRVLEPGGRLVVISVPDERNVASFIFKRPYRLKTYSDEAMRHMLQDAGFSSIEISTIAGKQVCVAHKV